MINLFRMGALVAKMVFKSGHDKLSASNFDSLNEIPVKELLGTDENPLGNYVAGKKVYLVVNVATN